MARRTARHGWPGIEPGYTFRDISGRNGALYLRVSHNPDKAEETKSVDEQEAEGLGWAKAAKVKLTGADVYKDDDRSASKFATRQRENFARLRAAIEAGR